jgi:hypothetical protein
MPGDVVVVTKPTGWAVLLRTRRNWSIPLARLVVHSDRCATALRYVQCAQARLLLPPFAAIARMPDLIRERTGEGRKRAMAEGFKFGWKRKLSEYQRAEAIRSRDAGKASASSPRGYPKNEAPPAENPVGGGLIAKSVGSRSP